MKHPKTSIDPVVATLDLPLVSKQRLLDEHNKPCPYCTRPMNVYVDNNKPTKDHIQPKSRFARAQTLIVCNDCNLKKADYTLEEWKEVIEKEIEYLQINMQRLVMITYLINCGIK